MKSNRAQPTEDEPFCALVFKIVADPYVGRLAYFRVYSGMVDVGETVQNSTKRRKERLGRVLRMYADRREELTEVRAGDIGATLGLKDSFTGDTLCDPDYPIVLESDFVPRSGHRDCHRAEDRGRSRQDGRSPAPIGRRRPDVPCALR